MTSNRSSAPDRAEYTALSERMGNLLILRFAMAVIVIAWAALRPEAVGIEFVALLAGTVGYLALSTVVEVLRRRTERFGHGLLTGLLLLDGLYLALAMYGTGGTQSPIRFLVYLHLVAVSLLASYRTGLKIALWDSLLLFVMLYAQAAKLVPPVEVVAGAAIEFDRMPVLNVTSFWLFALATSAFSALNERELRQRRADLQSMVEVGARLDDVTDPAPPVADRARRPGRPLRLRARHRPRRVRRPDDRPRHARDRGGADHAGRARLDRRPGLGAPRCPAGQAPRSRSSTRSWPRPCPRAQPARRADDRRRPPGRRDRRRAARAGAFRASSGASPRWSPALRRSPRSTCATPSCCATSRTWPSATP